MKSKHLILWSILVAIVFLPRGGVAQILGSADSFAVLAGSTATSVGPTILTGNIGVYPGTAITGFGPGTLNGVSYLGGLVAQQAESDLLSAYNALKAEPATRDLSGQDLGSLTLAPGICHFDAVAQLTGTLTLDAGSNPNAAWVFQIGSTLITTGGAAVNLINGASSANIFWLVGSSATLNAGTSFAGSILADQSITLEIGTTLSGRALAMNGAVTMSDNNIALPDPTPEPATIQLAALYCCLFIGWRRLVMRRQKQASLEKQRIDPNDEQ